MMTNKGRAAHFGLALPEEAREKLRRVGIFVQTAVTIEHQNLARRYVLRGVESGGAIEPFGHYVTFAAEDGRALAYLCRVESLAVNGPHAVVVAPAVSRAEMLRVGSTYELLITRHRLNSSGNGKRPSLVDEFVFRGTHGYLANAATGLPSFVTRAGEPLAVPEAFIDVTQSLTAAVRCTACEHCHYLVPAAAEARGAKDEAKTPDAIPGAARCEARIENAVPAAAV